MPKPCKIGPDFWPCWFHRRQWNEISLTHFPALPYNPHVKNNLHETNRTSPFSQVLFLFLLFFFSSCASSPQKPSPVVTQVERIQKVLDTFSKAYQNRDENLLFSRLDSEAKGLALIREAVLADFKQKPTVSLVFEINRVETQEASFQTMVHWEAAWKKSKNRDPVKKQGEVILVWINPEKPSLVEVRGDSPFGVITRSQ